jgi:SAM-dependent methyltransferase
MHLDAYRWVERYATDRIVNVLEVGSRNVNGGIRHLFPNALRYIGVDITAGPGVDVVANAADLCLDEMFDVAVSTEVLEHTPQWPQIVERMADHLTTAGRLILTAAGPGREPHGANGGHVGDEHYANVEPDVLAALLAHLRLSSIHVDQYGTDVRAYAIKG